MSRAWPLEKMHREILAREQGTIRKETGGRHNLVILYPNTYQVGMANLGLATVYRLVNAAADFLCERAFLPDQAARALYKKTRVPLLSLESSRPVAEFDLVLATLPFENDAPNLAAMLDLAGLARPGRPEAGPLVVAGGVVPMLNPEPVAPLVDALLLGEAEAALEPFLRVWAGLRGRPRAEQLLALVERVPGFYAPELYQPAYAPDGTLASFTPLAEVPPRIAVPRYTGPAAGLAQSVVSAPGPEFGDMLLLEVGRGCGHACRFCAAGHVFRPPRLGRAEDFATPALAAAARGERVGLVSAAVSDLPGTAGLARQVHQAGGTLSVSSLRADCLDPELVEALALSRHQTVALAPEAGGLRLRQSLNKQLTDQELFRAVEALIQGGVPNLKLYFMVGLPGETREDVAAIGELVKAVRQQVVSLAREKGHLGLITVSLAAFVPKPWTPFQWEAMASLKEIKARLAQVQADLATTANVKVNHEVPKYAVLQGVISRGDRRLAPLLGALGRGAKLPAAYGATGVDPVFYAQRARPREELLPWSVVDPGIRPDYLWAEAERARQALSSPPCDPEHCRRCGVCS
ncbi:MAG: radical SAM protein [Deltaproteobacteria bacterium]|nr:radical SAM protein [Deltaproteobacteria bacterium]